jgi:NADPH-dependent 2,4-dienoyl-CoA reductase/sulfur reductase-like enzyme
VAADRRRLTDILVAGAGPAGLALALQAHDHGVTVVRPDGYIGFHSRAVEAGQLAAWLALVSAGLCR